MGRQRGSELSSQPFRDESPSPSAVVVPAPRATAVVTRAFTGQRTGARLHTSTLGRAMDVLPLVLLRPEQPPHEAVLPATPSRFSCGGHSPL